MYVQRSSDAFRYASTTSSSQDMTPAGASRAGRRRSCKRISEGLVRWSRAVLSQHLGRVAFRASFSSPTEWIADSSIVRDDVTPSELVGKDRSTQFGKLASYWVRRGDLRRAALAHRVERLERHTALLEKVSTERLPLPPEGGDGDQ